MLKISQNPTELWGPFTKGVLIFFFLISFVAFSQSIFSQTAPTLEQGKKLFDFGEYQEAKTVLEDVLKSDPENHQANFILCKVYMFQENHDKAIQYGKKAVEQKDSNSNYHLWLGRSYMLKAQNSGMFKALFAAKNGKKEYEKAIELDSTNVEARFDFCMFLAQAPGIAGGDEKKAKKQAEIIQSQNPLLGFYAWGSIWEKDGKLDKAEASLRRAIELDISSTYQATYFLGYFLQRNEKYPEAVKVFQDILKDNPEDTHAYYQIGRTYIFAKDSLEKAEMCFKKYLEKKPSKNSPSWAAAHWRLGMVYDLQGKTDWALKELKKAVELEPESESFKKTLKEVEKKK